VFQNGAIVCVVNTSNGQMTTQALGSGNGVISGGQASDSITGVSIAYSDFASATSSISAAGLNGTPSGFTNKWGILKAGSFFQAPSATQTETTLPIVVGFTFTSQGQGLRPAAPQDAGSPNGPATAMTRRSHMMGMIVANSIGMSVGGGFANMYPVRYRYPNNADYGPQTMYTGVLQDLEQADYSFDDALAWEITRPYPTVVALAGAFRQTQPR
jgi:hypothetical protein